MHAHAHSMALLIAKHVLWNWFLHHIGLKTEYYLVQRHRYRVRKDNAHQQLLIRQRLNHSFHKLGNLDLYTHRYSCAQKIARGFYLHYVVE